MSDVDFFIRMYNDFKNLESYWEYKEYIEKYPELLPVIYAVRLEEKDVYLKFYSFLFDKILDEGADMQDMQDMTWGLQWEELRQSLLKIFEVHYNTLIEGNLEYTGQFWDDPLNIALSYGEIEETKWFCDSSSISWVDESTREECYGYIYQFHATHENRLCEQVESWYQAKLCRGFIDYISNLHTN